MSLPHTVTPDLQVSFPSAHCPIPPLFPAPPRVAFTEERSNGVVKQDALFALVPFIQRVVQTVEELQLLATYLKKRGVTGTRGA